jgi:hypothetical protein
MKTILTSLITSVVILLAIPLSAFTIEKLIPGLGRNFFPILFLFGIYIILASVVQSKITKCMAGAFYSHLFVAVGILLFIFYKKLYGIEATALFVILNITFSIFWYIPYNLMLKKIIANNTAPLK